VEHAINDLSAMARDTLPTYHYRSHREQSMSGGVRFSYFPFFERRSATNGYRLVPTVS